MIDYLAKAVKIPQIRNRIIFTLSILALYRFLSFIPVPNINTQTLKLFFESSQVLNILNIFTGGGLKNFSIIALGVGPYISASIVIQLMTMVFPKLEELSKEGTAGRQKINQYTQLLTLPLAIIQAFSVYALLNSQQFQGISLLGDLGPVDLTTLVLIMTSGTFLLMWLGEQISERGVGNGMSVIIFAGILAGLPSALTGTAAVVDINQIFSLLLFIGIAVAVIAGVVYINESFRKIEIMYSSKVRGGKSFGG